MTLQAAIEQDALDAAWEQVSGLRNPNTERELRQAAISLLDNGRSYDIITRMDTPTKTELNGRVIWKRDITYLIPKV